ncbi:MAG: delta 1-pyrroline-5-carboxylate synthetase [Methylophaga sp.]|nr:MAG: delta 1-pyrroline-5-carboxylate synthetase [Methylophaga sp.]
MVVVKIGGSLYNTPELKQWLIILAEHAKNQPIIIVPGGGPFAEQVRSSQSLYHFDDSHAHHMAILAMAQFGILLSGQIQCKFIHYPAPVIPVSTSLSIWLPDQSLLAVDELKHSWEITSDSLSLWLSQQLQADQLLLIKKAPVLSQFVTELIDNEVLDAGFAPLFDKNAITTKIMHYQDYANLGRYLSDTNRQLR